MILRALLSGNIVLFEEAMADLAEMPLENVSSYIHDRMLSGFRALYRKAGLPSAAYPAFREAIVALREGVLPLHQNGAAHLSRPMVERVLMRCEQAEGEGTDNTEPLLSLLRRFAVEAARDEARTLCHDLVARPVMPSYRLAAA
jgi:hypothetical protein